MIIVNLILFLISLFILIKSAEKAVVFSSRIARSYRISEFIVSFFVISVISVFPETTVSIVSALKGIPEFGLGTLIGSNVADLSLVFGIAALFSLKGIKVKSEILKNNMLYLILLIVPLLVGFDGKISRIEGIILILSGAIFFFTLTIESNIFKKKYEDEHHHKRLRNSIFLLLSLGLLIGSGYYTVKFGVDFAEEIHLPAFLIAITIVAVGTCLPELMFSIRAVRKNHNELALGDILGTVIMDATIILGIVALIKPIVFDPIVIYLTGGLMFIAGVLVVIFMKTGKVLSKKEGIYLLIFYVLSLAAEFVVNKIY